MTEKHLIWDFPLRLFHWSFAATVLASWYTAEHADELIDLHMQLGFAALALIIFRISWGIIGPKHARFTNFVPSPRTLIHYIKQSKHDKSGNDTAGHNPLGALMVVLMIVLILAQALSGLFINDDVFSSGPYYGTLNKSVEDVMVFIHHNSFNVMIAAIILHIVAIAFYWRIKKQNLVLPMITGKKTNNFVSAADAIPHSKLLLGAIVALCCAAFVYWLVILNAPVIEEFYY